MDAETETRIVQWRGYLARRGALSTDDVVELEEHLREHVHKLEAAGLAPDEAFLIGVNRIGRIDDLAREYAREHSERLWKQLVAEDARPGQRGGGLQALMLACLAAVAVKAPALVGVGVDGPGMDFLVRNAAVLVLPFLAAFFLIRRRARVGTLIAVASGFAAIAALLNLYPFVPWGSTALVAAMHGGVALWLVTGLAYANGDARSSSARMDFIRFTGEWFVYVVLLGLGGGVLAALTVGVFAAVGLDPTTFVVEWMLPCGAAGAAVIAAWLVEAKQSVIENIAPVLTRVFTPMFTLLLVAFIVAAALQGSLIEDGRELLIVFDLVLLVVAGLLLYSISARTPSAPPSWFEWVQFVMIVAALAVDILVLAAMVGRIGEFGASANRLASLGVNLVLVANLVGAGWLQLRFIAGRAGFGQLERWQTGFVPVYLGWSAFVIVAFPPLFSFA